MLFSTGASPQSREQFEDFKRAEDLRGNQECMQRSKSLPHALGLPARTLCKTIADIAKQHRPFWPHLW